MKFCRKCGKQLDDNAQFCDNCGANQDGTSTISTTNSNNSQASNISSKSRAVAALLAWFLGGLGVHNFYLGNKKKAIAQLVCTLLFFLIIPIIVSSIWVLVDFVIILCGTYADGDGKVVASWSGKEN